MKVFLFVLGIILILLFFPFRLKGKLSYNILKNEGYLSLFFYSIKLTLISIKFLPFKIKLKSQNKKFYLSFKDLVQENNFGEVFINSIFKVVKIKSIKFFSNLQFKDNSFLPYLTCGTLYVLFGVFYSFFSNIKNFSNIFNSFFN